ncbi:hypothetical protein BDY17DRAFT_291916 [Neohortaea acidophila]|uniref:IBR domain-containing protein n=1 Tax=Neohortaea acidophila TaxID=245834 RepID=A0A6A6Q4U9_9PEZI|nr:uncharacterized protein BDY17DRAFT_291916 [Neohortaea acidophila]KAF2486673.1 hypothetical protein BDY17DRAFT_291916 [Neohortaea acidophila]
MATSGGPSSEMPECIICTEPHPPHENASIFGSDVCFGCVCKMFEDAVHHEDRYPPKWGSQVLPVRKFRAILPAELYQRFTEKAKEYEIPPEERIYCKQLKTDTTDDQRASVTCGEYVGHIPEAWREDIAAGVISRGHCKLCSSIHCLICGDLLTIPEHICTTLPDCANDNAAFEGLIRGKDYQICPVRRCRRKIQLSDGCNLVGCVCGHHFCFVCGAKATDRHFRRTREEGGCPRYNHPSMPTALWQPTVAEVQGQNNFALQTFLLQAHRHQLIVAARRRERDRARQSMEREQDEHRQTRQHSDMQSHMERERATAEQHRVHEDILHMDDIPNMQPLPVTPHLAHDTFPTQDPAGAFTGQHTIGAIPPAYYLPQQHAPMSDQGMAGVARLMPGPAMRPRMEHAVLQMAPPQDRTANELGAFERAGHFGEIAPPGPRMMGPTPPLPAHTVPAPIASHGERPITLPAIPGPPPLRLPVAMPILRSGLRPYPVLTFDREGSSQVQPGAPTGRHDADAEQRLMRTTMRTRDALRRARVVLGGNEGIQVRRSADHGTSEDEPHNVPAPVPMVSTPHHSQEAQNRHSIINRRQQAQMTGMASPNAHSGQASARRSRLVGSLPDGGGSIDPTLDSDLEWDDVHIWRPGR